MAHNFAGIHFDGQQSDERILYVIMTHPLSRYIALIRWLFFPFLLFFVLQFIARLAPDFSTLLRMSSFFVLGVLCILVFLWNRKVYTQSKTFITDRRIVRFKVVSPLLTSKRMLFWNEVLKAKAHRKNFFWHLFNVGMVRVEPQLTDKEEVFVSDVPFYEDVANYIDKIIFTVKNKPQDIALLQTFIAKKKGKRY